MFGGCVCRLGEEDGATNSAGDGEVAGFRPAASERGKELSKRVAKFAKSDFPTLPALDRTRMGMQRSMRQKSHGDERSQLTLEPIQSPARHSPVLGPVINLGFPLSG